MPFELSIINGKTVSDIVRANRHECIRIVREAYLAHADGQSVNPDSYFLKFPDKPDCRIIALPAYVGNGFDVAGLKWIASFPGNVTRGFPRAWRYWCSIATKPGIRLPSSRARSSRPREPPRRPFLRRAG